MKTDFFVGDMRLLLRPADAGDDEFLYQVYASTRADEMALVSWTDEQKEAFLQMQSTAQITHYKTHYPRAEYLVIECDGVPVGRVIIDRAKDSILLIDIALLPEARSNGIGSTIVQDLMDEARACNLPLVLHVEFFNKALHLYSRLGFVQTKEIGLYYEMTWLPSSN